MLGAVVSTTVTVMVAVVVLPDASVTVAVTSVSPKGKTVVVGSCDHVTDGFASQMSLTVAVNGTLVPAAVACSTVMSANVIAGAVVSVMVTANVLSALLPEASVAVTVTTVLPNGKTVVAGSCDHVTFGLLSQISSTVADKGMSVPAALACSRVMSDAVIVGAVVSTTVMMTSSVALAPAPSLTVSVTVWLPSWNVASRVWPVPNGVLFSAQE